MANFQQPASSWRRPQGIQTDTRTGSPGTYLQTRTGLPTSYVPPVISRNRVPSETAASQAAAEATYRTEPEIGADALLEQLVKSYLMLDVSASPDP